MEIRQILENKWDYLPLLLLGDDESGLVITRPEILHDLADKILNHIKEE